MFELEVDYVKVSSDELSHDIRQQFQEFGESVYGVTLLPWEEHCTECAMPGCYETCDLYEPRKDGKCRRFIGGIVPVSGASGIQNHLVRVSFKRWGQLLAYANLNLVPVGRARRIEQMLFTVANNVGRLPETRITLPRYRSLGSRVVRKIKQFISSRGSFRRKETNAPDYFFIEIYNPNAYLVNLTFKVFNTEPGKQQVSYQNLLALDSGINKYKIVFEEISRLVDVNEKFAVTFTPNILDEGDEGLSLYFGSLTFVWDKKFKPETKKSCVKVVAWDLDNTIWDGVLVEDGAEALELKPGIVDIIKQLDERGILNTVVSKNNRDDALAQLSAVGLDHYILHPMIGWGQKSQYLKELVDQFNVGEDTFAFVDDSPFERDEALALNPGMRVYDAAIYGTLLERKEFNPPLSSDSSRRRELYRFEERRGEALSGYQGEYLSFLKDCRIQLNIYSPDRNNADRIQELVQRTNQLNFSGNRYGREEIEKILVNPEIDAFSMDCEDKYGQYGTVGFGIVDRNIHQMTDLMFSCRVQAKRIEHAFLTFLLTRYKALGCKSFSAKYNRTMRNAKAGEVFRDFAFTETSAAENQIIYEFDLHAPIPDDKIVRVLWNGEECSA